MNIMKFSFLKLFSRYNQQGKFIFLFFASLALMFFLFNDNADAQALKRGCKHIEYYTDGNKKCGINHDGFMQSFWDHYYIWYCEPRARGGCNWVCIDGDKDMVHTCSAWQKAITGEDYGICECEKECLDAPHQSSQNPYYYNDPIKKTRQNKDRIDLPVVLAWDDIDGWIDPEKKDEAQRTAVPNYISGPKSYRVEIKYEEYANGDSNLHIDKNKNPQGIETLPNGQKIFYKIIAKSGVEGFNSRDDGGACFFQTNSTYEWRVRPCCDPDGRLCKDYEDIEGWWKFSTSPGAELLGVVDELKYAKDAASDKVAHQDPDWNGPDALNDIDFCSAKLLWCKAKLVDVKPGESYNRFDKVYNDSQQIYAFNYQMRVKSSENTSLMDLFKKFWSNVSSAASSTYSFLGIDQLMSDYFKLPAASKCNEWMQPLTEKTTKSEVIDPVSGKSEACHHLQRNADGSCAKPATLSFSNSHFSEITNDPKFNPFFDSKNNTHQDQKFFTSSNEANLKYSWQIKPCFNSSPAQKDDDFSHCNSNRDIDFGQKWQLIGRKMDTKTLAPPMLTAPQNNQNWNDENNLIGANNTLNWTALCGANSFLYDIQDQSGNSIFKTGDCQNDYASDLGRRINKTQVAVEITDKDPSQGKDPEVVQLKIDTKYTWQVKSCWPSIPIGNINEICSNIWSAWQQFRTTGRPPANLWITNDTAPNVTLNWENVSQKGSYNVEISGTAGKYARKSVETNNPQPSESYVFHYDGARETYKWRVQTCADSAGKICGKWSGYQSYTTRTFDAPLALNPGDGEIKQLPPSISWNGNGNYFNIKLAYTPAAEVSQNCTKAEIEINATTSNKSYPVTTKYRTCPGEYKLTVQPCFESNCEDNKTISNPETTTRFSIADLENKNFGFMVCGQAVDNPATPRPRDESEPCEIKHLVLGLKVIIDFVIFKLAFLLLPVMVMITGAMFYLSHDKANLIPTLKDGWKKIGIGYGILFFAWIIVSILMNLVGYKELWNQIL